MYVFPVRYNDPTGHCVGVLAGVDTVACVAIGTIAVEALLIGATVTVINSEPFQESVDSTGEAIRDLIRQGVTKAFPADEPIGSSTPPGTDLEAGSEFGDGTLTTPGNSLETIIPNARLDLPLERPEVLGDNILRSSRELAKNMGKAGMKRPRFSAAHHIVAENDPRAAQARGILQREGIGINRCNKWCLFTKKSLCS